VKALLIVVLLSVTNLVVASGIAGAAEDSDWRFIAQWRGSRAELGPKLYYNAKRIEVEGDIRRGYTLLDNTKPALSHAGTTMLSEINYIELDCKKRTMATLEMTDFAENFGGGEIVYHRVFARSDLVVRSYTPNSAAGTLDLKMCGPLQS
jgi:hypothetical protein